MASRGRDLMQRLQHLGTATLAVGFAGMVVASRVVPRQGAGQLDQTRRLLQGVRHEVRTARASTPDPALRASARRIEATLAQIERLTAAADWRALRVIDDGVCLSAQAAVVFLSTGNVYNGLGADTVTLDITGNRGSQKFSFASGTSQAHIIEAINSFKEALGVSAARSPSNTSRINVSSTRIDADGFVRIRQVDGPSVHLLFTSAIANLPAFADLKDYGRNAITFSARRP